MLPTHRRQNPLLPTAPTSLSTRCWLRIPVFHSWGSASAGDSSKAEALSPKDGDGGLDQASPLQPGKTPASSQLPLGL